MDVVLLDARLRQSMQHRLPMVEHGVDNHGRRERERDQVRDLGPVERQDAHPQTARDIKQLVDDDILRLDPADVQAGRQRREEVACARGADISTCTHVQERSGLPMGGIETYLEGGTRRTSRWPHSRRT